MRGSVFVALVRENQAHDPLVKASTGERAFGSRARVPGAGVVLLPLDVRWSWAYDGVRWYQ